MEIHGNLTMPFIHLWFIIWPVVRLLFSKLYVFVSLRKEKKMGPKSQFLSYKVQNGTNLTSNAGHLQIHLYLQNLTFSLSTIFTLIKVSSTSSSRTAKMTRLWTEEKINKINVLF